MKKIPIDLEQNLKELRNSFDLSFSQPPESETDREFWHGLLITLAQKPYALSLNHLQEVLKLPHITRVPCASKTVRGIINLRGAILSVLNLQHFLNLPLNESLASQARILITKNCALTAGVLVDEVQGVIKVQMDAIQPPSSKQSSIPFEYLSGKFYLEERLVPVINLEPLTQSLL